MTSNKPRGELAELTFWLICSLLGFRVSKPYGDSAPYDFLVDNGRRVWRVQVKSTQNMHCRGFNLNAKHAGGLLNYEATEVDLIAAYIVPLNIWYLIPIAAISEAKAIRLYPGGARVGAGRFERYREAWCLMACCCEGRFEELRVVPRCGGEGERMGCAVR